MKMRRYCFCFIFLLILLTACGEGGATAHDGSSLDRINEDTTSMVNLSNFGWMCEDEELVYYSAALLEETGVKTMSHGSMPSNDDPTICSNEASFLHVKKDQLYFIGDESRFLYRMDLRNGVVDLLCDFNCTVAVYADNAIYLSGADGENRKIYEYDLATDEVSVLWEGERVGTVYLYEDRLFWGNQGLMSMDLGTREITPIIEDLVVYTFFVLDNQLYFADSASLNRYDLLNGDIEVLDEAMNIWDGSICVYNQSIIYTGSKMVKRTRRDGVFVYHMETGKQEVLEYIDNPVYATAWVIGDTYYYDTWYSRLKQIDLTKLK